MTQFATPATSASFNLWDEPWVRVLALDDTRRILPIQNVLTEAHTLKALFDPSPLAVCGTHRLLTAILQSIYNPKGLKNIADVLDEGCFDAAKIQEFAGQHRARFDLFDPTAPFMQTGDIPLDAWRKPEKVKGKKKASEQTAPPVTIEAKSIGYLFAELPTGINRIHFRHDFQDSHRICPACCVRGLVTIPSFSTAGGSGYKTSITGVPVYILPTGETLFHSLAYSLITPGYRPVAADKERTVTTWNRPSTITRGDELPDVGYIESLTLASRRVRLFPIIDPGRCTYCAQWSPIRIKEMLYEMGQSRKDSSFWKDPFVAYNPPAKSKTDAVPSPVRLSKGKAIWRDYGALFLTDVKYQPGLVLQMIGLIERDIIKSDQRLLFRCIGMRTDKAKVFEWLDDALNISPALLQSEEAAATVRQALDRAEKIMSETRVFFSKQLKSHPKAKRERFLTLRSRMEDAYWTALAEPFRDQLIETSVVENLKDTREQWAHLVLEEAEQALLSAIEQLGDRADMLRRRVEVRNEYRKELAKYRKRWNLVKQQNPRSHQRVRQ